MLLLRFIRLCLYTETKQQGLLVSLLGNGECLSRDGVGGWGVATAAGVIEAVHYVVYTLGCMYIVCCLKE